MNFVSYDFCFWVLSLFSSFGFVRTFHTYTTMLSARPTIFCLEILGLFPSFGFISNIPQTHITMFNAHPTMFCFRVFGLFRAFHIQTTMLNASPTIFCFRVSVLFWSFGFVLNIPHILQCLKPTPRFFVSEFWVCRRVLVLFGLIQPDVLRKN